MAGVIRPAAPDRVPKRVRPATKILIDDEHEAAPGRDGVVRAVRRGTRAGAPAAMRRRGRESSRGSHRPDAIAIDLDFRRLQVGDRRAVGVERDEVTVGLVTLDRSAAAALTPAAPPRTAAQRGTEARRALSLSLQFHYQPELDFSS
jgi:hypothetical protein